MAYLVIIDFGPGHPPDGPGGESQEKQIQGLKKKLLNLLLKDPDCLSFLGHNDHNALSDIAAAPVSAGNIPNSGPGTMAVTEVHFSSTNPMGPVPQSASITVNKKAITLF